MDDLDGRFQLRPANDAEDYTHRIGRTGRAGKKGRAITFVAGRELYKLQGMVYYAKLKIRREKVPSMDQVEEARENVFFEKLRRTLDEKKFRPVDRMVDRLLDQWLRQHRYRCGAYSPDAGRRSGIGCTRTGGPAAAKPVRAEPAAPVRAEPHAKVGRVDPNAPGPIRATPTSALESTRSTSEKDVQPAAKRNYERKPRTGREPGFSTVSFNVGRDHLVTTPADLVGKIAGVTRLPANVVGAIDIHETSTQVDVLSEHSALIVKKLEGIRLKGQELKPSMATQS